LQVQKFLNKLGVGDNYIWWSKALPYKDLGRGGAPAFDVSIWEITTYEKLANTMPIHRKNDGKFCQNLLTIKSLDLSWKLKKAMV
jgi:hypothetical protein